MTTDNFLMMSTFLFRVQIERWTA